MPLLKLEQFGVAFGETIILRSVDLEVPEKGAFVLLGPAGTGKSTLLRTIAGINDVVGNIRTWGKATFAGEELGKVGWPMLVAQNAKLMLASIGENIVNDLPERQSLSPAQKRELAGRLLLAAGLPELVDKMDMSVVELPLAIQRHLAIARSIAANPKLLCIDEPTAGLTDDESARLLGYIREQAEKRAIIVVLHNQQQAKMFEGKSALLAGGWIQECADTGKFFTEPDNKVAQEFIKSGSVSVPSPNCKPEDLDEFSEHPVPPPIPDDAQNYVSDAYGPRGFVWLKKGVLAGTPRPGIVIDEEYDLKALQRVGINVLISLTQKRFDPDKLQEYDIEGIWFPIIDMDVPPIDEAIDMCIEVYERLSKGQAVAYHCKAGLGRTGTMLAAQLIWEGSTALEALEYARRIEPRWVQSEKQVAFLEDFANAVANTRQGAVESKVVTM